MTRMQFIDEPIKPVEGTMDPRQMARGEPALPGKFIWRGTEYAVAGVIKKWKETGPCESGANEQYVRRHYFLIRTTDGREMAIYFERTPRKGAVKDRWHVGTATEPKPDEG